MQSCKKGYENVLLMVKIANDRFKRDSDIITDESKPVDAGPVLYISEEGNAMIYSSRPLYLRTNYSEYNLGNSKLITFNAREKYARFMISIPYESGKIQLRYSFSWDQRYWSLQSIQVMLQIDRSEVYDLNVTKSIGAPMKFSYHCPGRIAFVDPDNMIELTMFDIQIQPTTLNAKFSDAYDCITFTTVPIWSGLLVSFTVIVGLFIGIGALASIKTMDKFDNHKTKQLCITLSE